MLLARERLLHPSRKLVKQGDASKMALTAANVTITFMLVMLDGSGIAVAGGRTSAAVLVVCVVETFVGTVPWYSLFLFTTLRAAHQTDIGRECENSLMSNVIPH